MIALVATGQPWYIKGDDASLQDARKLHYATACGPTTATLVHVSILPTSESKLPALGNVFRADSDAGRARLTKEATLGQPYHGSVQTSFGPIRPRGNRGEAGDEEG